ALVSSAPTKQCTNQAVVPIFLLVQLRQLHPLASTNQAVVPIVLLVQFLHLMEDALKSW
ncbi:hypothetical protein HMPREF0673_02521, partial [Leyella stercorea DSM 18206]